MKRFVCLIIVLAAAVSLVFANGAADAVSGATAKSPKGKIVIYTSMYPDVVESLRWKLKSQFRNCEIEFVYGGTGELQTKLAAEEAAKKFGCDMLLVADPSYSMELKEKGMLHNFKLGAERRYGTQPTTPPDLAFDSDPDGYWYPVRVSNMVLAFNPDRTPQNSVPNSFYDFAFNTSVRGAVAMSNPLTSGTAMAAVTALKDKYGYEYFDALGSQGVQFEAGPAALAKLETGEYKVVMILEESVLQKQQQDLSELQVIYPTDGTIIIPSTIMTIADKWSANNNTKTAEIITEWFLSPEGQNAIVESWMHSTRKNFHRIPYGAIPTHQIQANSLPVNWENGYRQRDEIQSRFEAAVINRE